MVSDEKDHERAIALVRTGYHLIPAVRYPTWGAVVARDRERFESDLPALRADRQAADHHARRRRRRAGRALQPVQGRRAGHAAAKPGAARSRRACVERRLALAERLDGEFAKAGGSQAVAEKQDVYRRTARLVLSPRVGVFDLSDEPDASCATPTAGPSLARAACSPGGWWSRGSASSR